MNRARALQQMQSHSHTHTHHTHTHTAIRIELKSKVFVSHKIFYFITNYSCIYTFLPCAWAFVLCALTERQRRVSIDKYMQNVFSKLPRFLLGMHLVFFFFELFSVRSVYALMFIELIFLRCVLPYCRVRCQFLFLDGFKSICKCESGLPPSSGLSVISPDHLNDEKLINDDPDFNGSALILFVIRNSNCIVCTYHLQKSCHFTKWFNPIVNSFEFNRVPAKSKKKKHT